MPVGTIDIYVDTSFFAGISGSKSAYIANLFKEADSIGERFMPVEVNFPSPSFSAKNIYFDYTVPNSGTLYIEDESVPVDFQRSVLSDTVLTSLVEYSGPLVITSGTNDYDVNYTAAESFAESVLDSFVDITNGIPDVFYVIVAVDYTVSSQTDTHLDNEIKYTVISPSATTNDADVAFSSSIQTALNSGTQNPYVDLTLAGYVFYHNPFITTCGLVSTDYYVFETTISSGGLDYINADLTVGVSGTKYIGSDLFCGLMDYAYINNESEVIPGGLDWAQIDVFSTTLSGSSYNFDVNLYPLKISELYGETSPGFILEPEAYMYSDGKIYVEITDDIYNVTISGCYWVIDGTVISGTFVPITDGYKMYYDPVDDFSSLIGSTEFLVHAENDNGDYLEKSFYLTSGYIVEYDNTYQNYGANQKVVVRMLAENNASCPVFDGFAYYFETAQDNFKDLPATIKGLPVESKDLSASISPQTDLLFLYGKTFRVEIRAKDFSGNEMEPYIFEFRIEDDPNS